MIPRHKRKPYEVDLGAEKFFAAERDMEKIVVEVKSFIGTSVTYDFHEAFGQYNVYNFFMGRQEQDIGRVLFLAVPEEIYNSFFTDIDTEAICTHYKVQIVVFDAQKIEIIAWIKR